MNADPIGELVRALRTDGKPPLAWIVRWSRDGRDPVAVAWDVTQDADAMEALLGLALPSALERATALLERVLGPGWYHRTSTEIAPVIRRAVPDPPSLESVLARRG